MPEIPILAAFLSLAVPLAAALAFFKRPLAAAWDGPFLRRLRAAHWTARVAALIVVALVTAHGGGKGGGTNEEQSVVGDDATEVVATTTNAAETVAFDEETVARMVNDLRDAEADRLGLEPGGEEWVRSKIVDG